MFSLVIIRGSLGKVYGAHQRVSGQRSGDMGLSAGTVAITFLVPEQPRVHGVGDCEERLHGFETAPTPFQLIPQVFHPGSNSGPVSNTVELTCYR